MDSQRSQESRRGASASPRTPTLSKPATAPRLISESANAICFPCIVSEWQKNSREVIRITLSEYQGCAIVDCRQWYSANEGEWKPSPKGLSLAVSHLPALADAITKALTLARKHGLVEGGGE